MKNFLSINGGTEEVNYWEMFIDFIMQIVAFFKKFGAEFDPSLGTDE